ncbi:MAG: VPLPA-CTERM sorting domain-containing protein [Gammaproteobacteria bacterium]|nr:VPLPA-CTERM sorting domain-containing protein [Gammaproteobacteria bacterium]
MKKTITAVAAVFLLAAAVPATAAVHNLQANIDGTQSGTGSSATGFATMSYDDVSGQFDWNIQWSGLQGNISVAHFHGPALPGQNAGVTVNFGSISGLSSPSIGSTVISALQGSDLLGGLWYINIHSDLFPGGEIRGQVGVVPLPAAAWLLLSAVGGLFTLRRRKA